jgi:glucan biosynthesis protein C
MDLKNLVETPSRLYYIDWVRVLAMVCVFLFHNARFFDDFSDWHVRNTTTNFGASMLVAFLGQWMMPLFFLISGAAAYYALKSRNAGKYSLDKVLRLLVPLIFGLIIVVAPQAYYDAISHGKVITGNIFQIYYLYLTTVLPTIETFHLWFLIDLFVFSFLFLPLFVSWGKERQSILTRIAGWVKRLYLFLPLFIIALSLLDIFIFPDGYWGNRNQGSWNIIAYGLFFMLGYLIFANPRIMESVKKMTWVLLGVGVITLIVMVAFFVDTLIELQANFGSASFAAAMFIQAICAWCWLLAILGLAAKFLNKSNRFLNYANEAVLPFYVLHQTIIVTIGYYVVQWNTGVGLKYLTIATTSFIGIMAIYEFLVRRINPLRFLFGMKLQKNPQKARL